MAVLSATLALAAHAVALQQRIFVNGGQNLSLLNIGSLVSLLICIIMTIVASRNRGWLLLPIVYSFALINLAFATFVPNAFITHLEATPGMMIHIGGAVRLRHADYRRAVCVAAGVDRLPAEKQTAGVQQRDAAADDHRAKNVSYHAGRRRSADAGALHRPVLYAKPFLA